jgi:catechol 2,3-dioxygenase-like lactoylglutathione lyase family enzyme
VERAFVAVTPVIPARDVAAGLAFYVEKLGFAELWRNGDPPDAAAVRRGGVTIHLFACDDPKIAQWTALRIETHEIDVLYERCERAGIVHPNGRLEEKPWGNSEFTALDLDGVGLVFWEPAKGR